MSFCLTPAYPLVPLASYFTKWRNVSCFALSSMSSCSLSRRKTGFNFKNFQWMTSGGSQCLIFLNLLTDRGCCCCFVSNKIDFIVGCLYAAHLSQYIKLWEDWDGKRRVKILSFFLNGGEGWVFHQATCPLVAVWLFLPDLPAYAWLLRSVESH